ncbi:hypothetical protein [Fodinibius sp. AD559]|uniref:hypothetical protein n=1 Tax=Fodinibius sp. AD559 TaxID=3424179 RepID=UPI004046B45C
MFSNRFFPYLTVLFLAGFLFVAGCSKSDDQREFENQSLSAPNDYTVTPTEGEITDNDPDDWRISPMYRGFINIGTGISSFEPPYPNPMGFNQELTINIYLSKIDNLDRIKVYSFEHPSDAGKTLLAVRDDITSPSLVTPIRLNGEEISGKSGGSQANGLYRIRILDGNLNVITYGDIKIGAE